MVAGQNKIINAIRNYNDWQSYLSVVSYNKAVTYSLELKLVVPTAIDRGRRVRCFSRREPGANGAKILIAYVKVPVYHVTYLLNEVNAPERIKPLQFFFFFLCATYQGLSAIYCFSCSL